MATQTMETPRVRPGTVPDPETPRPRVVAYFRNSSPGNLAIQRLVALGIPSGGLAVMSPERLEGRQGMVLSIPCGEASQLEQVESLCRALGAEVHRQKY
jgi:hypothetical protein